MKRSRKALLAVACLATLSFTSCATSNLIRWGLDRPSVYHEPDSELSRGILKPTVTFLGVPVAVVWDVVTLPFQAIFGVYPYGDTFMEPSKVDDI